MSFRSWWSRKDPTAAEREALREVVRQGVRDAMIEMGLAKAAERVAPATEPPPPIEDVASCGCGNAASHFIGRCPRPGPPIGEVIREYAEQRRAKNPEPGRSVPETPPPNPAGRWDGKEWIP